MTRSIALTASPISQAGRFLNEDPIGFGGGINFYSYVGNSPATLVDPMGTCADDYTKKLNQCAADLASTISAASLMGLSKDSFWGQALAGNDISSMSNFITNSDRLSSFTNLLTSNPTPANLTSMLIQAIKDAPVGVERATVGENGAGTAFVKDPLSKTVAGKLFSGAVSVLQRGKLLYGTGTYLAALYVCMQQ